MENSGDLLKKARAKARGVALDGTSLSKWAADKAEQLGLTGRSEAQPA